MTDDNSHAAAVRWSLNGLQYSYTIAGTCIDDDCAECQAAYLEAAALRGDRAECERLEKIAVVRDAVDTWDIDGLNYFELDGKEYYIGLDDILKCVSAKKMADLLFRKHTQEQ